MEDNERRPDQKDLLETRVAVIEREVFQFSKVFDKFDQTIDKLTDVTHAIEKMLPLMALQISDQEKSSEVLDKKYDKLEARVDALERWKWIVIGIVAGLSFLAGKIPWHVLTFDI